jgi:hypothetical protein
MLIKDVRGQSMLMVLIITLAIFLTGSAALALGTNAGKIAAFEVNQEKAYYIAEAGIEKVMADARYGRDWLMDLNTGSSYDYLANNLNGAKNYGEGTFEYISVKKLAEDNGQAVLELESWGKCRGCTKKIWANAIFDTVYAKNLFRGLWIKESNAPGGHVFNLHTDVYFSNGDAVINEGSEITGNIYSRGTVCFQGAAGNATVIEGDVYAAGGVALTGPGPVAVSGFIYVDDISKVPEEFKDIAVVLPAGELNAKIPDSAAFPELLSAGRLKWYRENACFNALPDSSEHILAFTDGIYFLAGGQELSGTYSGNAVLVVDGGVTIGGLSKNDEQDSLAVLSAGDVSFTGGSEETDVLIYAGNQVDFNNGVHVSGSVLSPVLASQGSPISIANDENMLSNFRDTNNWSTCFIRITKWSE